MSRLTATIERSGAVCSIGIGVAQVAASIRAGISRFAETDWLNRAGEPFVTAAVPDGALEALRSDLLAEVAHAREARMLRLAAPALREAAAGLPAGGPPPALLLGLPEHREGGPPTPPERFIRALSKQAGVALDETASRAFALGRPAALIALREGLRRLSSGSSRSVLVGGVDSLCHPDVLATFDVERRLLGSTVADGFVPGEGAAFLAVAGPRSRADTAKRTTPIVAVGIARDEGHRYSPAPAKGEGLWSALGDLEKTAPDPLRPVRTTFCTLNGENLGAREWGVASIRCRHLFDPQMVLIHPADCYGETGGAAGALLLAIAHRVLTAGQREAPALVWASADREERACVYLDS